MATELADMHAAQVICQLLDLPRSTYYYQP